MSFSYLSASAPGLTYNYSLFAVPAGWFVAMAPLWWAIGKATKEGDDAYNNAMPAESWANLKERLPEQTYRRVIRAVAANTNSHVNLPLFAAGLAVAHAAHVDAKTLHLCSAGYIGIRIAYNLAYILIEDPVVAWVRSILYLSGVGTTMTLFVSAANKFKMLPW